MIAICRVSAAMLLAAAGSALAQTEFTRIAAGTPITFEFAEEVSSRTGKIDQTFPIRLVQPVEIAGVVTLPTGTVGVGQIVHRARSGLAGKAGELIVAVRYLEYRGVRVPLRRFRFDEEGIGADRVDQAFSVNLAAAPVGYLIFGGEKIIKRGTLGTALVAADVDLSADSLPPPAAASPPQPSSTGEE